MIYQYRCPQCGKEAEAYRTIANRHDGPPCCGLKMQIEIRTAPYGYVDREIFYKCPVTNEGVTSKRQRREILAREGLVSAHELISSDAERDAKEQKVIETRKRIERERPKEVQEHVNAWAKKELDL